MARLLNVPVAEIQADRAAATLRAVSECNCSVILKGAGTRIADPDENRWLNLNGNPGLGTAGSGDVLGGLLAALQAQGMSRADAANAAVYLHGRAGDLAARRHGQHGMTARDLLDALPHTLRDLAGR
jgi:ADP-dependent NAD(P)H-hydrate dehydratase / NAD(P)H-hydrate epimerase